VETLSVRQPYASFICNGLKDVENRTYKTNHRGRLLIHACGDGMYLPDDRYLPPEMRKEYDKWWKVEGDILDDSLLSKDLKKFYKYYLDGIKFYGVEIEEGFSAKIKQAAKETGLYMPSQAIIGECQLIDVVNDSKSEWAEKGCFHWILKKPTMYKKPIISVLGHLRLWQFDLSE
jgi:hypothetical protein